MATTPGNKTTKKTTRKSSAKKKAASKKTGEALRKEALKEVDQNIARIDGEALAETSRANRRKAAASKSAKTGAKVTGKQRKAKAASKPTKEKKPSGLDLAAKVLAESKEPLASKAIAERAIAAGWKTSGKTPHATLYAAMIREIRDKGKESRFEKVDRGLFKAGKGGA